MGKTGQGLEQGAGLIGMQGERQAGQGPLLMARTAAQQQKTGAVARHVINRIGQHLEAMLCRRLP